MTAAPAQKGAASPAASPSTPPKNGPATAPRPLMDWSTPNARPRCSGGVLRAMSTPEATATALELSPKAKRTPAKNAGCGTRACRAWMALDAPMPARKRATGSRSLHREASGAPTAVATPAAE